MGTSARLAKATASPTWATDRSAKLRATRLNTFIGNDSYTCNGVTTQCAQLQPCYGNGNAPTINNGNNNVPTIFLAMLGALAAAML
jgi:hypothetical protein